MRAFEFLLVEAQGGMWDRMLEKKSGANIQFLNGNQTYELVDVAVFPKDARLKYEADPENPQNTINFGVATSVLKHTIKGDVNCVSEQEVLSLVSEGANGRIKR